PTSTPSPYTTLLRSTYASDWQDSSSASIGLTAPYHRRLVELAGDMQVLAERGVRAVVVEVSSDFFGRRKVERRTLRPAPDAPPPDRKSTRLNSSHVK